jgi:cobalamin biosynthesis protein CobT
MLLKAGVVCQLKEGEECENTAIASERVASEMIGLTTAVAIALNHALKDDDLKGADPALLKKWCVFYSHHLLPQTKATVKRTSPKLDAYGLFLPSRMGTTVAPDILEKGLHLHETEVAEKIEIDAESDDVAAIKPEDMEPSDTAQTETVAVPKSSPPGQACAVKAEKSASLADEQADDDDDANDEYEYEDEDDDDEDAYQANIFPVLCHTCYNVISYYVASDAKCVLTVLVTCYSSVTQ